MENEKLKTGTTNVAVVCKDCIIMGADRRITAGNLIMGKDYPKIYPITDNMVITISGVVSDVQLLTKHLRADIKLKHIRTNRAPTVKEIANLMATWNYSMLRSSYAIGGYLLGGFDKTANLFSIMPDGALKSHKDYAASGSGSIFCYGVLETNYKEHMTEAEGIKLVEDSLNAAMQRDSASGNGIDIYVISKDGAKQVVSKVVNARA